MEVINDTDADRGSILIKRLTAMQNLLNERDSKHYLYSEFKGILHDAICRLRFLELVVTGLTYQEQEDAKDYAEFVANKRRLQTVKLDIQKEHWK